MSGAKRTEEGDLDDLTREGQRIAVASAGGTIAPRVPPTTRPTLRPTAWPSASAMGPIALTAMSPPRISPAEAPPRAPAAAQMEETATSAPKLAA